VVHTEVGGCAKLLFNLLRFAALEATIAKVCKESMFVKILDNAQSIWSE